MSEAAGFTPTHVAPATGLQAWLEPGGAPAPAIPAGLEVQLLERNGEWAHIVCSNEWSTWVDGRELVEVSSGGGVSNEVMQRLRAAVNEYEQAVIDAEAGRIDDAEFRRRVFKAGMVVGDDEAWFLDLPNARWCRYDGVGVTMLEARR